MLVVAVVMVLVRALFHGLAAGATRRITGGAEHADQIIGPAAGLNAHAPGSEIDLNICFGIHRSHGLRYGTYAMTAGHACYIELQHRSLS
jgi:hypothetical protein